MYLFYVGLHVNVSWKYIRLHDVAWNVPGDCLFIVFCHLSYVNKFAPSFFTYFNAQKHEEMHQHYIILEFKLFLYNFKSKMILMNLEFCKRHFAVFTLVVLHILFLRNIRFHYAFPLQQIPLQNHVFQGYINFSKRQKYFLNILFLRQKMHPKQLFKMISGFTKLNFTLSINFRIYRIRNTM